MDSWGEEPPFLRAPHWKGFRAAVRKRVHGWTRARALGGHHVHDGDPLAAASQRAAPGCPAATASPDEGVSRANRAKCAASAAGLLPAAARGFGASGLRGCSLTAYFAAAHCHGVDLPPPPVSSQQRHVPGRGPGWRCARWTLSVSASGPVGSHGCQWAWPRGVTWN